ncbi:MAG: hypothetical protein LC803_12750 [Acidobacteria bacterium]|nr:hypothetical protein [Acidobacteriota bacterium]
MIKRTKIKPDPLPEHFLSLEQAAEFWDEHDSADYEEYMREVVCEVKIERRIFISPDEDSARQGKR